MQNKLIMIVDDMSSSLEIMKLILSKEGFGNVVTFDCPLRALHEIEQGTKPDIIITDFHMQEMNGLEFLASAQPDKCKTRVVIISGDTYSIKNCPEHYIKIDKGDFDFFRKLLSAIYLSLQMQKGKKCNPQKKLAGYRSPLIPSKKNNNWKSVSRLGS